MSKSFGRRTGGENGGKTPRIPFNDDDFAELLRKERAMAAWNARHLGDIPEGLAVWCVVMGKRSHDLTWDKFLAITRRINAGTPINQPQHGWSSFPRTSEQIEAVLRWRAKTPAA